MAVVKVALFLNGQSAFDDVAKRGRRDEARKRVAELMRRVEEIRIREGMSKTELAMELGANVDGVRAWMTGR